jgi:hypothetical protein
VRRRPPRSSALPASPGTRPPPDGQRPASLRPRHRDRGEGALLVGAGLAVVLVEGEAPVAAGVDDQTQRVGRLLARPLERRTEGHDGAGAQVGGHRLVRGRGVDRPAAGHRGPGPEVVPGAGRKVDRACLHAGLGHGTDEEGRAEQVLVLHVAGARIVREVHDECPHDRVVLAAHAGGDGVVVRQEPVPQVGEPQQALPRRVVGSAEEPGLALRVQAVGAEDRAEGPELDLRTNQ